MSNAKTFRLTVKTKLILLSVIITVSLLFGIFTQYRSLTTIRGMWDEYNQYIARREHLISAMKSSLGYGGMIHHFKNYVLRQDPKYVTASEEDFTLFNRAREDYLGLPNLLEDEVKQVGVVGETMSRYRRAVSTARSLFSDGKTIREVDKTIKIDDSPALQAFEWLSENRDRLIREGNTRMVASLNRMLFQQGGIFSAILLVTLLFSLLISSSITGKLKKIISITEEMAAGNLSRNVDVKPGDEIGDLADNFNRAVNSLRKIINSVKETSSESSRISDSLSEETQRTSASVEEITANIESINKQFGHLADNIASSSTAVEEILANTSSLVNQISHQALSVSLTSAAIEEMTASIDNVAKIASTKKAATDNLVSITQDGGEKVDLTNRVIQDISKNIDDMMELITVINNVASQTNLLSMNAAIEAAHAGEFGKGFAVVADEIRKLAESTADNSKNISRLLNGVIDKIKQALESSTASGETFTEILKVVSDVVGSFAEISTSTEELAAGSQEVRKAGTELLTITEEIRRGSEEMKVGAEHINDALSNVKNISAESVNGINEISIGSSEINRAVVQISELSKKNSTAVAELRDEMRQFNTDAEDAPILTAKG